MEIADYKYDVFFSYKRHDETLHWTREVCRLVKFYLQQELNRSVDMFVDENTIDLGAPWPDSLRQALKLSRCMVGVWSPEYFRSSWCVSEWRSFLEREKSLHARYRLVAPLCFHDGEHFPKEARETQTHDIKKYASTLSVFWQTERALELEDELKKFCKGLSGMINKAPQYDPDWPVFEDKGADPPKIELARL